MWPLLEKGHLRLLLSFVLLNNARYYPSAIYSTESSDTIRLFLKFLSSKTNPAGLSRLYS